MGAVRVHYFDASALVKLVAEDKAELPGREQLRAFFFGPIQRYATSYCIAEALSAFKLKWLRKDSTEAEYLKNIREFFRLVVSSLVVDEVPLSLQIQAEAERLVTAYKIDFIDSIQLVTVLQGRFSVFVRASQTLFVTADRRLANAARKEGAKVWLCTKGAVPA